jgi:hypothetical protein
VYAGVNSDRRTGAEVAHDCKVTVHACIVAHSSVTLPACSGPQKKAAGLRPAAFCRVPGPPQKISCYDRVPDKEIAMAAYEAPDIVSEIRLRISAGIHEPVDPAG